MYVAPNRVALDLADTTQLLVGRVAADGRYEVIAVELGAGNPPAVLGAIPNLEARVPDGFSLFKTRGAAVSETGFLVLTVGRVVVDEGESRLAIFDLAAPDAPPWFIGGHDFRLVGDRLWVVSGDNTLDVFDLPNRGPKTLTLPPEHVLVRDDVVPFFLTESGAAVLLEAHGVEEPTYSLLRVDAIAPPLGNERFAWTTAREQPFGPGRARIRIGINCGDPAPSYCIDREVGDDTSVDVVDLADAAWALNDDWVAHVGANGLGRVVGDGRTELIVRFDREPNQIVGIWSNVAIVQFADGALGGVYVGTDLLTQHPLGPDSILDVPGDVLLRSLSWFGEPP